MRDGLWFTSPAYERRSKLSSSQTAFRPERAGEGLWPFVSRNPSQIVPFLQFSLDSAEAPMESVSCLSSRDSKTEVCGDNGQKELRVKQCVNPVSESGLVCQQ